MTASSPPARARLKPEERRAQLIGIGLRLLTTRPIHEMSIDEVAAEAGISRGLLFHYFPTKRDYYVAVVRAGGDRLLMHAGAPEEGTPGERVRGIVDGFVSFVRRRRDNYVAVVRGQPPRPHRPGTGRSGGPRPGAAAPARRPGLAGHGGGDGPRRR